MDHSDSSKCKFSALSGLGSAAFRPLHLSHKGCLWSERHFLGAESKTNYLVPHPFFTSAFLSTTIVDIKMSNLAPRDEKQQDCIVLIFEWFRRRLPLYKWATRWPLEHNDCSSLSNEPTPTHAHAHTQFTLHAHAGAHTYTNTHNRTYR